MSSLATFALLEAVYARLSTALSPVVVYNLVPQGTAFPYVTIGEPQTLDDGTKTDQGQEHILTIQTFSTYRGEKEALQIASSVYSALHESTVTLSGHDNWMLRFDNQIVFAEPDGLSTRVVQKFRVRTQPQ